MDLILMVGNIGCGKSTLANRLGKMGAVVINNDAITTMVQGGDYGRYDSNKKKIYRAIEVAGIEEALNQRFDVVVDRTNMRAKDRATYIEIGKKYGARIVCYDFGPGRDYDINRRLNNPRGITEFTWKNVYRHMLNAYEQPIPDEGITIIRDYRDRPREVIHAFDFDGTICQNAYPGVGKANQSTIAYMRRLYATLTNYIVIWTCRQGDALAHMRAWLIKNDVPFDFINENPFFDTGSRKIYADYYYDDRAVFLDIKGEDDEPQGYQPEVLL